MNTSTYKLTLTALALGAPVWTTGAPFNPKDYALPYDVQQKAEKIFTPKIILALNTRSKSVLKQASFILHPTVRGNIVAEHPSLPGWIIKGPRNEIYSITTSPNISRISGANKLRQAIARHGLESIFVVPQKYLFHYPGHSRELSDKNYCVFAEKLPLKPQSAQKIFNNQQLLLQFATIAKEADFLDIKYGENVMPTTQGTIAFIDTEDNYFSLSPSQRDTMTIDKIIKIINQKYHLSKLTAAVSNRHHPRSTQQNHHKRLK